ncbi:MAG: NifU family protein [Pseudomonadota bacterium]
MEEQVKKVLEEIRPMLQADGGDIEFIALEGDVVKVRLQGACAHCPGAQMTLKNGVERILKEKVEGVGSVEAV